MEQPPVQQRGYSNRRIRKSTAIPPVVSSVIFIISAGGFSNTVLPVLQQPDFFESLQRDGFAGDLLAVGKVHQCGFGGLADESFIGAVSGPLLSFLPKTEIFTYRFGCTRRSSSNVFRLRVVDSRF